MEGDPYSDSMLKSPIVIDNVRLHKSRTFSKNYLEISIFKQFQVIKIYKPYSYRIKIRKSQTLTRTTFGCTVITFVHLLRK